MIATFTKFKHLARASQETLCFEAVLYLDGLPAMLVTNAGHGGANERNPLPGQTPEQFQNATRRLVEYVRTLPPRNGPHGSRLTVTPDLFLSLLAQRELHAASLRRRLKRRTLFTVSGKPGIFEVTAAPSLALYAELRETQNAKAFLNAMPFEDALTLYLED